MGEGNCLKYKTVFDNVWQKDIFLKQFIMTTVNITYNL